MSQIKIEEKYDGSLSLFKFTSNTEDWENLRIKIGLEQWILRGKDGHDQKYEFFLKINCFHNVFSDKSVAFILLKWFGKSSLKI